jgi:hypothetical protein
MIVQDKNYEPSLSLMNWAFIAFIQVHTVQSNRIVLLLMAYKR